MIPEYLIGGVYAVSRVKLYSEGHFSFFIAISGHG
jgi:hypothetical protein